MLLSDADGDTVFVAESDGRVIGCISIHTCEPFHRCSRAGRITALVVDADYRSQGIGRALVEMAEKFCESKMHPHRGDKR